MKNIIQNMPGYHLNDYLIILNPHEELRTKILKLRKEFADEYDAQTSTGGKAYLGLLKFQQLEMMEERIVQRLKVIAMGFHAIRVELKDFGSYPSHSIYINVTSREPLKELITEIKKAQQMMRLDAEHKPHFFDDPHINIAHRLKPWQYEKGWLAYSHRQFTGRFIADGMLLLKRKEGSKAYQILQRFEFMNLPVTTKQGELFG